jgi:hypothetical protein
MILHTAGYDYRFFAAKAVKLHKDKITPELWEEIAASPPVSRRVTCRRRWTTSDSSLGQRLGPSERFQLIPRQSGLPQDAAQCPRHDFSMPRNDDDLQAERCLSRKLDVASPLTHFFEPDGFQFALDFPIGQRSRRHRSRPPPAVGRGAL